MPSYHDVKVYIDGVEYIPFYNYALELTCTKVAGWQLMYRWHDEYRLLGGEYHEKPFCIMVGSRVICGKKPKEIKQPEPFGWDGMVYVDPGKE